MSASLAFDRGGTSAGRNMNDYDVIVIDREPGDNQNPVTFCDADACCSCGVMEGDPDCLRRKADFCLWLAVRFPRAALGAALNKLGLNLIKDSKALELERAVLSRRKHGSRVKVS
jgi:hypothetical protein